MAEKKEKSYDKEKVLIEAKEGFAVAMEVEQENRTEALDDLKFARMAEQWSDADKKIRTGRPCLTVNKLPAFIRQVVNDSRQNKPSIKVHPADSQADPETAEIYDGLIRNIEVMSRAGQAYDTAVDHAVTMGFGYFRIGTRYAHDDAFDLDLFIDRIANPFSVFGDPYSTQADSSDWNTAFVTELITREEFKARYKNREEVNWEDAGYDNLDDNWSEGKRIRVAEWWKREQKPRTLLLLSDQSVIAADDYTDEKKAAYEAQGVTVVSEREVKTQRVCQYMLTGAEVLEKNDWGGKYIPIVPVYGDEVNVEGKRYFRSLVRDAKDPQRMFNYWRSASTELVALAPKAPYIGPTGAFETDKAKWETANTENHAYIEYDIKGEGGAPQRQHFAGVPAGVLQEALNASDDIKAIIGIYDAGIGARSNETSGKAINARQRESDVSTFHFIDNLSRAIEHAGRILIDLIPKVYTGERIVRILGKEDQVSTQQLGKPVQEQGPDGQVTSRVYDLGLGKYDLTVTAGPSFTTRREEAAVQMTELIRAYPDAAPVIGDLLAKNLDWPGADEIAKRLQAMLPAQLQGEGSGGEEQQQALQQFQEQVQQLTQQLQQVQQQLDAEKADKSIEAQKLEIDGFRAETERMKAQNDAQANMVKASQPPAPANKAA